MPAAEPGEEESDTVSLASCKSIASNATSFAEQFVLPDDYRQLLEDGTYMKVFTDNGKGKERLNAFHMTMALVNCR